LSIAALGSLLVAELPTFKSYLPSGFAIPGITAAPSAPPTAAKTTTESKSPAGWLWPVVLLGAVLIACLIWYFNRGTEATTALTDTASQATTAVADTAQNAIGALGAFFKRKLPDGVELNIPENGIENKLIAFIEDSSKPVDKETWFDFDRLLFATGSATLEPSSTEQLQNVAAILKAYPNVHLRIGGYTDNTGDAAANMKLSQERASSVLAQLVSLGVDPSRLDAKGYGEEHPVADNATEAGRAQNRRISVRVTQK
jgi:outer membrane protein OmpA-like peptidoglycan-associated protein